MDIFSEIFLDRFSLPQSSEMLRDTPVAHASLFAGSGRDVFGVLVAPSGA